MSARDKVRKGGDLVVTGSSGVGYRLAHRGTNGELTKFGTVFARQKDAIQHGETKFKRPPKIVRVK